MFKVEMRCDEIEANIQVSVLWCWMIDDVMARSLATCRGLSAYFSVYYYKKCAYLYIFLRIGQLWNRPCVDWMFLKSEDTEETASN